MDIFMEPRVEDDNKSGISSYLDDFLSAIKVFGYLDRTVFHELTKQMRTYKMEPGEIMRLKDEKGFAIVVDGSVQVFAKAGSESEPQFSHDSQTINGQRYQLLNEVNRGAPMSSLFTILSLFTEDVQLNENLRSPVVQPTDHVPDMPSDSDPEYSPQARNNDPLAADESYKTDAEKLSEEIIARASVNTTVAIIPEEAFRNLTRKFPKATSHIVQVILTRCQRVTFQTGHFYLGLTPEMFQPEMILNLKAKNELPSYLHDGAVRRLQEMVRRTELQQNFTGESSDVVSLYNEKEKPKRPSTNKRKNDIQLPRARSRQVVLEPDSSHPGDLLSNVPLSRREMGQVWLSTPPAERTKQASFFTGEDETEDSTLRMALAECIFKFLGLDGALMQAQTRSQSVSQSVDASPVFTPVDGFRNGFSSASHRNSSFGYLLNNLSNMEDRESDRMSSIATDEESVPNYENAQREAADNLEVMFYRKGTLLSKQNEKSNGLYYVVDGVLEVGYTDKAGVYRELHTVKPGGLGGYIGAILGYRSFADIRAKTDVYLGFLPRKALEQIADKYPMVYLNLAKTLTSVLSRLILHLDFALEWVHVRAGQVLFHQGDDSDAIYIVLNGRLRSVVEENGKMEVQEEFGQGESIGELEVLTLSNRPFTLHAIRDSELARFPRSLFESLALEHPSITFEISRLVASRVRKKVNKDTTPETSQSNFRTVAVIPVTAGLPVMDFGQKLLNAYNENNNSAVLLNNASVLSYLGRHAFNKMGRLKLSGYLADLEERYKAVIYVADTNVNAVWTQACIAQADCILLLADARSPPYIGEYERLLVKMKTTARTELILLHPDRYVPPGSTAQWLKNRIWVHSHHHVQMQLAEPTTEAPLGTGKLEKLRNKVQSLQYEFMIKYKSRRVPLYSSNILHKNDFNRLARILSGQAVGLVLGGGGARGISHIGIIRALEENGIPIDFIGGTSIGSFVGGLYAKEYDLVPIYGRAKKFASRIASLWRMALDLTYPTTSYTTGHEFNRGIWKTFGDSRIEDFWIKFFCNTTNITHSRMEAHRNGYAWRYIRASMSLAGLLPPMTDKGSMLLDGGYVDNLPVAEMRSSGARYVFAVDVGSIDDVTPMSYGDSLSGVWVLFNRWNIFSKHPNVPNLAEIQQRLAYVSSVGALEKAKNTPGVIYLRPPIDNYATLDFGKFDEIYRVGTRYGNDTLTQLKAEDKLPSIPGAGGNGRSASTKVARRNSI
jgi:lysophospholipid hydrolase